MSRSSIVMSTSGTMPSPRAPHRIQRPLPSEDEMFDAFLRRDTQYDGIFVTAVESTGIFCRPSCPARKPQRRHVRFFSTPREALAHGFRPCKRCLPLELPGRTPEAIRSLIHEIEAEPGIRLRDEDLRERGLDPRTVRRWFQKHHGMTFHSYQRGRRLARALAGLAGGENVAQTAFENGYESLSGFDEALRQITGRSATASRDATVVHLSRVETPLGPMLLGATDSGVCLLEFTDRRMLETQLQRIARRLNCAFVPGSNAAADQARTELEEYFARQRTQFDVPLDARGTDFQERVWTALREIPFGETRSYGDQARMIGSPSAVRAVARANGDNRIAIIIPCHRVIGSNGTLTGYGGGIWRKRWLLHHEKASFVDEERQLNIEFS